MKIIDTAVYPGPNVYARCPTIRHLVEFGPLGRQTPAQLGPRLLETLQLCLPRLGRTASVATGSDDEAATRKLADTPLPALMQIVARELLNLAGHEVRFGIALPGDRDGTYRVAYEYGRSKKAARMAGRLALDLMARLLPEDARPDRGAPGDFDAAGAIAAFAGKARAHNEIGISTEYIVKAAEARGIPWSIEDPGHVMLGQGRLQQRIVDTTTGKIRRIPCALARNKAATVRILGELGLPVPRHRRVLDSGSAVRYAERIGYPVVVKPLHGDEGQGVSVGLTTADEVAAAFRRAAKIDSTVLVEQYIAGRDHRLLVVDGEMIAACMRVPGHVTGDGVHTIEELLARLNLDPRRDGRHFHPIQLDDEARRKMGDRAYDRTSVPPAGDVVYLRSMANVSAGGTSIGLTELVHPDNREMAVRAARGVGLDIAGIDFITPDIARSYRDVGGAICEVNSNPSIAGLHIAPMAGSRRDVSPAFVDMLFAPGSAGRVPSVAIGGVTGKRGAALALAHLAAFAGNDVGVATGDGTWSCGAATGTGDMPGASAASRVLRDPEIDAAVIEVSNGSVLRNGLGFDFCNAVVLLDGGDARPEDPDNAETISAAMRLLARTGREHLILNADDPFCRSLAGGAEPQRVCFATTRPLDALPSGHVRAGGVVVSLQASDRTIAIHRRRRTIPVLPLDLVPAAGDAIEGGAAVILAVVAAAHALGMPVAAIRDGLQTLESAFLRAPLRMKVVEGPSGRIVLGLPRSQTEAEGFCRLAGRLGQPDDRVFVLAASFGGTSEIVAQGCGAAAGRFGRYICVDPERSGPEAAVMPRSMADRLRAEGVPAERIQPVANPLEAMDLVTETVARGQTTLILTDDISGCLKRLRGRWNAGPVGWSQ